MFYKNFTNINFYLKRSDFLIYFDHNNVLKKKRHFIRRIAKKENYNRKQFKIFKTWVLWKWVSSNLALSDTFIRNFRKLIKKLDYDLSISESKFIFDIEELVFTSWRPLKELPVRFNLEKHEYINFMQSNVNWHKLVNEGTKQKANFIDKYWMYYSKKNIYLCDKKQRILEIVPYSEIEKFQLKNYGVIITWNNSDYLVRDKNKVLTYVILNRIINNNRNILNDYPNLIEYFDLTAGLLQKFN